MKSKEPDTSCFGWTPLFEEARFNHGVGCLDNGDHTPDTKQRLYVKRTPSGWTWHCFNCGASGFKRAKNLSVSELRSIYANREADMVSHCSDNGTGVCLPSDFSREDIPLVALTWLRKYGITPEEITHFRFGYSQRLDRLILPVFKEDGLVYWQGRYFGKDIDKPKYLNVRAKSRGDIFFSRNTKNTSDVVLVEDILSAIKVGRVTGAVALLGSYVPDSLLTFLGTRGIIRVWLDRDKAMTGIRSARRITALTGRPAFPVITPLDPKEYSEQEILAKLGGGT